MCGRNLGVIACAVAMLIAPATALGQQFSIGGIDASDGGVAGGAIGTGIDIVGGTVYQNAFQTPGAIGEPNQVFIGVVPDLVYDSYLTVDSGPVEAAPGYDGSGIGTASEAPGSMGFTANSYRGLWFFAGPFQNAFAVDKPGFGPGYQLFLGRITHTGSMQGRIQVAFAEPGDTNFSYIVGDIIEPAEFGISAAGTITENNDGAPLGMTANGYAMAFIKKEFQVDIEGTTYTVSDIYLQSLNVVPSPGAAAPLALMGLAVGRRRRR
ncbi:MAG: hypothetical protein KDA20_01140 [Phycisphaerales bacterium]|nr:hypothetical protein [Phycisphaerales bacterium]